MRRVLLVGVLAGLAPAVAACTTTQAKGKPADMPAMNVPAPPPHEIAPPAPPEPPPPEPVAELPPVVPPATRTRPPRETPHETKPEPKPEPSDTAPLPQTPNPPAAPVPPLRTPSTADDQTAARNTRTLVDRARGMLNAVDYRLLTVERKAQYDTAKRFLEQADDAIKGGNFVFAQSLGEKAETIARELAGK